MAVYEDFYLHYVSGVYSYAYGNHVGDHAILIVGYEDNSTYPGGGYFRVKNSWSPSWGEDGFFRIAYSELNSVVQFGDWTVAYLPPEAPPSAPSSLTATPVSSSQINLSWVDNAGNESGFKIERRLEGDLNFSQIATVGSNVRSYSNTGLMALSKYNYRVKAYNTGGDSDYSNIASGTTLAIPPAPIAPSLLKVISKSNNQIKLSWTDNSSNEDGFKIERCTGTGCSNFSQVATVSANATTYTNTGLRKGTTYSYRVYSYNAGGNSSYSNVITVVATR
jgi:predicted phage tail protein